MNSPDLERESCALPAKQISRGRWLDVDKTWTSSGHLRSAEQKPSPEAEADAPTRVRPVGWTGLDPEGPSQLYVPAQEVRPWCRSGPRIPGVHVSRAPGWQRLGGTTLAGLEGFPPAPQLSCFCCLPRRRQTRVCSSAVHT